MTLLRRTILTGGLATVVAPRVGGAEPTVQDAHRAVIEVPLVSEDPAAVPIQVSVEHHASTTNLPSG